jgi:hypothetical protein
MSTWRYFVTDEQLKAKKWNMQEEAKALKGRVASLENELRKFAASWREVERFCASPDGWTFRLDDEKLIVVNSRNQNIASAPWLHFDAARLKTLIGDLQQTKEALEIADEEMRRIG